jgi:hypothetical protein
MHVFRAHQTQCDQTIIRLYYLQWRTTSSPLRPRGIRWPRVGQHRTGHYCELGGSRKWWIRLQNKTAGLVAYISGKSECLGLLNRNMQYHQGSENLDVMFSEARKSYMTYIRGHEITIVSSVK